MLSIGKCRDLDYYEREVIDGREDYLSESGSSPGRWVGRLAAADGLTGVADRRALAAAFRGERPDGSPIAVHRRQVAGFDLTLSPSKSVSLMWALGTEDDARQVEEALYAARDEVERYLEASACFVRRGHAGVNSEPGSGFTGAVFLHRTSRLGDPGIHLHWTVFNVAEGPDGRRTALDASENGTVEPRRFYESPFTDVSPLGPDALFESRQIDRLIEVVAEVRRRAEAA